MKNITSTTDALRLVFSALRATNNSATFFVTGQYYENNRSLVHEMLDNGFEVGYHGHTHTRIENKVILEKELNSSRLFINNIAPAGFRAPWIYFASHLLSELPNWGFKYDSSTFCAAGNYFHLQDLHIYPVTSLPYFGTELEPAYPKRVNFNMLKNEIPIGSGIFVSLLREIYNPIFHHFEKQGNPMIFYIHDWQLILPPERQFSLFKDKIRYIHRFPLINKLLSWIENHRFTSLDSRLQMNGDKNDSVFTHYLTIDVEYLGQ